MIKRRVLLAFSFLFIISFLALVIAADTNISVSTESKDKGYACLEGLVNKSDITLQEAIFGVMAIGSKSNLVSKIDSEKSTTSCWPKAACTIKDTAQAMLAYKRIGRSTSDIESWLSSKNSTVSELSWFLEIDIIDHVATTCNIKFDAVSKKINIGSDMKISGDPGSCLTISPSGFWLKIKDSCLSKKFDVSCNKDFVSTILYQKTGSDTVYVSSKTQSSAYNGTTTEEISARCLKLGTKCDYEGTLWAALALKNAGKEISSLAPYLVAMAEDNKATFPSAIIYLTSGGDDQFSEIISSIKQSTLGSYWEAPSSKNGKLFDTSLGIQATSGADSLENTAAREYIYKSQQKDGCWNNKNLRDTAFILYSLWPKTVSQDSGGSTVNLCEPTFFCVSAFSCPTAQQKNGFDCTSLSDICCGIEPLQQTCAEKEGELCSIDEECSGLTASSSDGTCCLSGCVPKQEQQENTCEPDNGVCKSVCGDNEQPNAESCGDSLSFCCEEVKGSSSAWIWIIIILILLILVVLAIIFRDKLRIFWFKYKGKASTSVVRRPGSPPETQRAMPLTRPAQPQHPSFLGFMQRPIQHPTQQPQRPISRPVSKDKDMEETLKKLREMSK
jgi:hypothetical protein